MFNIFYTEKVLAHRCYPTVVLIYSKTCHLCAWNCFLTICTLISLLIALSEYQLVTHSSFLLWLLPCLAYFPSLLVSVFLSFNSYYTYLSSQSILILTTVLTFSQMQLCSSLSAPQVAANFFSSVSSLLETILHHQKGLRNPRNRLAFYPWDMSCLLTMGFCQDLYVTAITMLELRDAPSFYWNIF